MNTSAQLNRKMEANDEAFSPEPYKSYWVQCAKYRCVGLLNEDGKWISAATGEELTDIVTIYPL